MSKGNQQAALPTPRVTDPRWQEKIATANRARQLAAAARAGKPSSFREQVGRVAQ